MLAYYFRAPKPAARLSWPSTGWADLTRSAPPANRLQCYLFSHPRIRFDRLIIPMYGGGVGAAGNLRIALHDPRDGSRFHYDQIAYNMGPGVYVMHESLLGQVHERPPGWLAILAKKDEGLGTHYIRSAGNEPDELFQDLINDFDWSAVTLQLAVGAGGKEACGGFAGYRADADFAMPTTLPDWSAFTVHQTAQFLALLLDGSAWEGVRDLT